MYLMLTSPETETCEDTSLVELKTPCSKFLFLKKLLLHT